MKKLSSYQKLKNRNEELEGKIWALRAFISKATTEEMLIFKKLFFTEESIIDMWWQGSVESEDNTYNGLLNLIKADEERD